MQTTYKSIKDQIADIHTTMDIEWSQTNDKLDTLHHHLKVVIQHVMKLEAKAYYIQKKLDETLGLRPRPLD